MKKSRLKKVDMLREENVVLKYPQSNRNDFGPEKFNNRQCNAHMPITGI